MAVLDLEQRHLEYAPRLRVGHGGAQRRHVAVADLRHRVVERALAALEDLRLQRQRDAVEHRVEEVGLVAEVPVHRAARDAGRARDLLQRGARHAAALEFALGHVEDARAGALGVLLGASRHGVKRTRPHIHSNLYV